ncbi:sensor histidine kinase [Paenibacillus yanchengensis]|uniref:histidine kinase n=1 Tax=Paenibacillus yanchengensis TaxID=2035833 RepID=A0ABW4YQN8_9BACL
MNRHVIQNESTRSTNQLSLPVQYTNNVNSIAELEEVESIAIISKSLVDMFRYSIKQQGDLVLLSAEIEHISNYMNIQSFRYGNKLSWSTAIDPELEQQPVLKLILQPLVENAVYHGLELKKGGRHISVHGFTTETGIRLEVRDDGIGIDEQKLEQLQTMLAPPPALEHLTLEEGDSKSDNRSIGLYNVHARIAFYYGADYGLDISSSNNQGTIIGIRLPHHHDRIISRGE